MQPTDASAVSRVQWRHVAWVFALVLGLHLLALQQTEKWMTQVASAGPSLPEFKPMAFETRTLVKPPAPVVRPKPNPQKAQPKKQTKTASVVADTTKPLDPSDPSDPSEPSEPSEPIAQSPDTPMDKDPPPSQPLADTPTAASEPAVQTASELAGLPLAVPGSVRLKYRIELNFLPVSTFGELSWLHDGAQYEAKLTILFGGSLVRTSRGAITNKGIEPARYGEKIWNRSETAVHFQRDKGVLTFSNNKPELPLQDGMQDEVSVFFEVASLLGGDIKRFPEGSQLAIKTAETRAMRELVFKVGAQETLDLPGGRVEAIRLTHSVPPEYPGSMGTKGEIWAAPSKGYLPVRILIQEPNGKTYNLLWNETLPP